MSSEKGSKHLISMIVPTRNRPQRLRAFLDSIVATTTVLEGVEILLVIDSDDSSYDDLQNNGLAIRRVTVSPGLPMGELNMAGYGQSTGDYIFLLNDDVVLRTSGWDEQVLALFRSVDDGILLVHVNDRLFEEKLCTFPFVTRKFCEQANGICPKGYQRYRIDDHIYNIFNLLSVLGHNRIFYLPDVVFEHQNYVRSATGSIEYRPDEAIHAVDTELFESLLGERKTLAIEFAALIDEHRKAQMGLICQQLLVPISDSISLRKPEYVRVWRRDRPPESKTTRVTIGIVSADIKSAHAQACVAAVKKYTRNFDLVILDNNFGPNFNHPREMNRILGTCRTDFLVLMDDDVIVEAGWLDGLLRCATPEVGIVTPLHKSADGVLSYAGVVMAPDYSGDHSHAFHVAEDAFHIQTLCSAIMLIDMEKCGHLRVDESYSKYFLDIDYGLRVWESGFAVVCSPHTLVTHLGGATLTQGSMRSNELFEIQRAHYVSSWIRTGRYRALEHSPLWQQSAALGEILGVPQRIRDLANPPSHQDKAQLLDELQTFFKWLRHYPALLAWVSKEIGALRGGEHPVWLSGDQWAIAGLSAETDDPALIEANFRGFNIVLWNGFYYAVPQADGPFIPQRADQDSHRQYRAPHLPLLKALIEARVNASDWVAEARPISVRQSNLSSIVIPRLTLHRVIRYARRKLRSAHRRLVDAVRGRLRLYERMTTRAASLSPESRKKTPADRDSRRWVSSSPVMQVVEDHHGWAIYRHEFKYFAIPASFDEFDYRRFQAGAYGPGHVGFSLVEVKNRIDRGASRREDSASSLVFGCAPADRVARILADSPPGSATLLWPNGQAAPAPGAAVVKSGRGDIIAWAESAVRGGQARLLDELAERHFDKVVIPWSFPATWRNNALEVAASKIADSIEIVHANGVRRSYFGENLHRLIYNKAYLCSMFESVPEPRGSTVLEVGCSDGLVCDIFALLGAKKVVGIDVMQTVGCSFPHPAIEYRTMEAGRLDFPDRSFDMVYSIATLEHVPDPAAVLGEIVRVLKIGGYAYVQAAPLYHSPFGHHMFSYYGDYPWIHLRKTKEEIAAYSREKCIASAVQRDYGIPLEKYLDEMLSFDHVNGLFLGEFGLDTFRRRSDIRILKFNQSYEGQDLLTADIKRELRGFNQNQLTEHGFELAIQRVR